MTQTKGLLDPVLEPIKCNCIMSGYAQTTNYCPVHKDLSMFIDRKPIVSESNRVRPYMSKLFDNLKIK